MLLSLQGISKTYGRSSPSALPALDDVSIAVEAGECVGLVGESGSGKSTLINCALRLVRPDSGDITYDGIDLLRAGSADMKRFRREVQLVFQDPYSSLNPRMTVEELVGEGLIIHKLEPSAAARRERIVGLLEMVGLGSADMSRYPRTFSGGQRQRIAIARALAVKPRILVCDEPVSALDVSVQAQVINLLRDMQQKLGLAILFVAHDLAVVRYLCSSLVVLHRGKVVERGTRQQIFDEPRDPYTRALLAAVPVPDPLVARARRAHRHNLNSLPIDVAN